MTVQIEASWEKVLQNELQKDYFIKLSKTIDGVYRSSNTDIFPPEKLIYTAFMHCSFEAVKVVILGQDPYHNDHQAHGLAFSVPEGVRTPPSLRNIYKEIQSDIGTEVPINGNLERWADQGVLLLNTSLTVEAHKAGSHSDIGWETFTDAVIQKISDKKEHVVFLLWGAHAQKKGVNIDTNKHLVLTAPHPSPLSAYRGFLGCKHFSQTNRYLNENEMKPVRW
jgi:uracil-DNA glycosylase